METGKVLELGERDFGFIKRSGKDKLFFHADALQGVTFRELKPGDTLSFAVTQSLKGPYATQVTRV